LTLDTLTKTLDRLSSSDVGPLLKLVAPVITEIGGSEAIRAALVRLVKQLMVTFGPESLLAFLPQLESHLPASHSTLLRPVRLGAEVLAGKRPADLPTEPEEVRRVVREFLDRSGQRVRYRGSSPQQNYARTAPETRPVQLAPR